MKSRSKFSHQPTRARGRGESGELNFVVRQRSRRSLESLSLFYVYIVWKIIKLRIFFFAIRLSPPTRLSRHHNKQKKNLLPAHSRNKQKQHCETSSSSCCVLGGFLDSREERMYDTMMRTLNFNYNDGIRVASGWVERESLCICEQQR